MGVYVMVMDFLKKYQEELIAEKIDIKEDYDLLLSKIKENEKFLELLREENQSLFSDFTPREVSYKHKDKMVEVKELLNKLQGDKISMEEKIHHLDLRLEEVLTIIDSIKNNEKVLPEKKSTEKDNNIKLKQELQNISSYILSDPTRANIELQHIISNL